MSQAAVRSGALLFVILVLTTCSHAPIPGGVGTGGTGGSGTAPFALTLTDAPPAGVTVLTFQLTVSGAVLLPGNVSVVNSPVTVDLTQLQNESVLLAALSIPTGTYTSLTLTVSSARLTILNETGATIGTCANGAICTVTPTISPLSVSLTGPSPLVVTSNTPAGLQVEAVLSNILQSNGSTLSLNLTASSAFALTPLPSAQLTSPIAEIDDVAGQVTNLGTNQFTLLPLAGLTLTSSVDSSTAFGFPSSTCAANNFSCLAVNQIIEVDLSLLGNGTFLAKSVVSDDAAGQTEVQGTITSVTGSPPTQFQIVVNGAAPPVTGVAVGDQATVTFVSPTTFLPDPNMLTLPGGFSFASASDLLVGQNVMVQVKSVTTTSGISISTGRVVLRMSQITAQVGMVNVSGGSFMLVALPSLFVNASPTGITSILAQTIPQTMFFNLNPPNINGVFSGNNVSVKGLLFNPVGGPTLVTEKVRGRDVSGL